MRQFFQQPTNTPSFVRSFIVSFCLPWQRRYGNIHNRYRTNDAATEASCDSMQSSAFLFLLCDVIYDEET